MHDFLPSMIQENVDLQSKNTLGLKSRAAYFAEFRSLEDVISLYDWAKEQQQPLLVLGGGSNLLMPEKIEALVIQSVANHVSCVSSNHQYQYLDVDAGKNWHEWVLESTSYGHGLENLALIPGSVGAAPIQNIGAYGVEVCQLIESVTGYQLSRRKLRTLSTDECEFSYRDSIFKNELKNDFVIPSVRFRLAKEFSPDLSYAPLDQLDKKSIQPIDLINKVVEVRQQKLPDPSSIPNAGSFFKNPVVEHNLAERLKEEWPDMPQYRQSAGTKIAVGWLIETCGFKGKALGLVKMHDRQALVMTARQGACLESVLELQKSIHQTVFDRFGVSLEREPLMFGD